MKKIIVVGCPGSGKSTFSRALHTKTGIPLYHLDLLYWNPDRTKADPSVFQERLASVIRRSEWILDGNYASTMEFRLQACDTVFFLDYSLEVCLSGIRERRGKKRPDMPWTEAAEEEDTEFLHFIQNFQLQSKPQILNLFGKYSDKNIHNFSCRSEADAFLSGYKGE